VFITLLPVGMNLAQIDGRVLPIDLGGVGIATVRLSTFGARNV